MISIICPVFNKEEFLKSTIESILAQSFTEFELLLIDGGSKDDSLEIISQFKDKRIKLFEIQDIGIAGSRNFGVLNSKFEFCAFIDADDFWEKEYLQSITNLIKLSPNSISYATAYKRLYPNKVENVIYNEDKFSLKLDNYFEKRLTGWGLHTSSIVYNKSKLISLGGFPILIEESKDSFFIYDINGKKIESIPSEICSNSRWSEFDPKLIGLNIKKPIRISIPGIPGEDQFLWDKTAFEKNNFCYTSDLLSNWRGDVKNQATRNPNELPIYPQLIFLNQLKIRELSRYRNYLIADLVVKNLRNKPNVFKTIMDLHIPRKTLFDDIIFKLPSVIFKKIIAFKILIYRVKNKLK